MLEKARQHTFSGGCSGRGVGLLPQVPDLHHDRDGRAVAAAAGRQPGQDRPEPADKPYRVGDRHHVLDTCGEDASSTAAAKCICCSSLSGTRRLKLRHNLHVCSALDIMLCPHRSPRPASRRRRSQPRRAGTGPCGSQPQHTTNVKSQHHDNCNNYNTMATEVLRHNT